MSTNTDGFTLIEMLVTVIFFGVVTAMVVTPLRDSVVREAVRGARHATASHVARARGAASSRGCAAVLHVDGGSNRVWVTACDVNQPNGIDTVGTVDDLSVRFDVNLTTNMDSVSFAPTGLLASSGPLQMRFAREEFQDSIGVSPTGRLLW